MDVAKQHKNIRVLYFPHDNPNTQDTSYQLRTDLAQLTINYNNGSFDHFFIVWNNNDIMHNESSLQKVHKKDNTTSLTSNCESSFI